MAAAEHKNTDIVLLSFQSFEQESISTYTAFHWDAGINAARDIILLE